MSWRLFLKSDSRDLRVQRVQSNALDPLPTLPTLNAQEIEIENVLVTNSSEWQETLCIAHAEFNNWCGRCSVPLDDCPISRVLDSGGDIEQLRGMEIGQGVTSDEVINLWFGTGEKAEVLFKRPAWLIFMAEHIRKHNRG